MAGGNYQNNINNEATDVFYFGILGADPLISQNGSGFTSQTNNTDIILRPNGTGDVVSSQSQVTWITILAAQTDNTDPTSHARIAMETGGASAGDPYMLCTINGVTDWSIGLDNDDSDKLVLSQNSTLGTNNVMEIHTDGEINFPLQPGFSVSRSSTINNVTGDGTAYYIIFNYEQWDTSSDFNLGTSIFTAPVGGKFWFNACASFSGVTGGTIGYLRFETSNRTYYGNERSPSACKTSGGLFSYNYSILADLDSGDTCRIVVMIDGVGADTSNVYSGSYFNGKLIC